MALCLPWMMRWPLCATMWRVCCCSSRGTEEVLGMLPPAGMVAVVLLVAGKALACWGG